MRNILYIKKIVYRTNYCLSLRLSIRLVCLSFSLYKTLRLSICVSYLDVISIIKTRSAPDDICSQLNQYKVQSPSSDIFCVTAASPLMLQVT